MTRSDKITEFLKYASPRLGYIEHCMEKQAMRILKFLRRPAKTKTPARKALNNNIDDFKEMGLNTNLKTHWVNKAISRNTMEELIPNYAEAVKALTDKGYTVTQAQRFIEKARLKSMAAQKNFHSVDMYPGAAKQQYYNDMFWAPKATAQRFNMAPVPPPIAKAPTPKAPVTQQIEGTFLPASRTGANAPAPSAATTTSAAKAPVTQQIEGTFLPASRTGANAAKATAKTGEDVFKTFTGSPATSNTSSNAAALSNLKVGEDAKKILTNTKAPAQTGEDVFKTFVGTPGKDGTGVVLGSPLTGNTINKDVANVLTGDKLTGNIRNTIDKHTAAALANMNASGSVTGNLSANAAALSNLKAGEDAKKILASLKGTGAGQKGGTLDSIGNWVTRHPVMALGAFPVGLGALAGGIGYGLGGGSGKEEGARLAAQYYMMQQALMQQRLQSANSNIGSRLLNLFGAGELNNLIG